MLLGGLGARSGEDLESEVDVNKEIADFMKSMLSPIWEHGFLMVWGWICDGFEDVSGHLLDSEGPGTGSAMVVTLIMFNFIPLRNHTKEDLRTRS